MSAPPSKTPSIAEAVAFAEKLADAAREIALRHFRTALDVRAKADASPVTVADLAIESRLRAMIRERHPCHGVVGEEEGGELADGPTWVIDPIDGTASFACGVPLFGVLIALMIDRVPVLGVIEHPALAERWASDGGSTRHQGRPVRTSGCAALSQARVFTTDPDAFDPAGRAAWGRLAARARLRRLGADCYAYGLLASGHADVVVDTKLGLDDVAALVPVVEGAGGVITDWAGRPLRENLDGRVVAAASAALHREALQAIAGR